MIIEFQGCSLEIAHIGTRKEIEREIYLARPFWCIVEENNQLWEYLKGIANAACEAGRQLAAFLKTDEGKQLVELCGVWNK
jgi:hypothetical protein